MDLRKKAMTAVSLRGLRRPYTKRTSNRNRNRNSTKPTDDYPYITEYDTLIPARTRKAQALRNTYYTALELPGMPEWIARQQAFLASLSQREEDILASYTHYGDRLVNSYLRGTLNDLHDFWRVFFEFEHNIPFAYSLIDQYDVYNRRLGGPPLEDLVFPNEDGVVEADMEAIKLVISSNLEFFCNPRNIEPLLEQYARELSAIIRAAPKLTHPLVVYRGFKTEDHLSSLHVMTRDFTSTTTNPLVALRFSGKFTNEDDVFNDSWIPPESFNSGVYEITALRGTPCLYMESITLIKGEYEVLFAPQMDLQLSNRIHTKMLTSMARDRILTVYGRIREPPVTKAHVRRFAKMGVPNVFPTTRGTKRMKHKMKHKPKQSEWNPHFVSTKKKFRAWTRKRITPEAFA